MSELKPGEKKILEILTKTGSLTYSEIEDKTGLSNRAVSNYINSLQIKGFIIREIEEKRNKKGKVISKRLSRRYKLKPISYASLLFNDITDFMKKYLEKAVNEDLKKGINIYSHSMLLSEHIDFFWLFLLEKKYQNELQEHFTQVLKRNPETLSKLIEISEAIENVFESYVLSTYNPNQKEIIETYSSYLLQIVKRLRTNSNIREEKGLNELFRSIAEYKLKQEYPNIDAEIPEEMIRIKAEREIKKLEKATSEILQPYNLDDLISKLKMWNMRGELRKEEDLTEKEVKEIEEMGKFLETPKNKRLYEKYLSRLENRPKSLLIYPSLGFKGYLDELKKFPDVFEKQFVEGFAESLETKIKKLDL